MQIFRFNVNKHLLSNPGWSSWGTEGFADSALLFHSGIHLKVKNGIQLGISLPDYDVG